MGKFDFNIPPDFIKTLGKLSDVDALAPKMIDEATPILQSSVKSTLSRHKQTGEMISSIKRTRAKKKKNGGYIGTVRPTGTDAKGVRNMEKAAYLEYGTSKQAASPWIDAALGDCESAVLDSMKKTFEREVKK